MEESEATEIMSSKVSDVEEQGTQGKDVSETEGGTQEQELSSTQREDVRDTQEEDVSHSHDLSSISHHAVELQTLTCTTFVTENISSSEDLMIATKLVTNSNETSRLEENILQLETSDVLSEDIVEPSAKRIKIGPNSGSGLEEKTDVSVNITTTNVHTTVEQTTETVRY